MKIVSASGLMACPKATIFSAWQPVISHGLYQLDQVVYFEGAAIDFWYRDLKPVPMDDDHTCDTEECHAQTRWGEHDISRWSAPSDDEYFAVYERDDLMGLNDCVTSALRAARQSV